MKIRFIRDILLVVEKPKLEEFWDKPIYKWSEFNCKSLIEEGKTSTITIDTDDVFWHVPNDAFEMVGPKGLEPLTNRL